VKKKSKSTKKLYNTSIPVVKNSQEKVSTIVFQSKY